jgi:hypothetical protein
MFPIRNGLKQGDALSQLLFSFALEYAVRRVQVNISELKHNFSGEVPVGNATSDTMGNLFPLLVSSEQAPILYREVVFHR